MKKGLISKLLTALLVVGLLFSILPSQQAQAQGQRQYQGGQLLHHGSSILSACGGNEKRPKQPRLLEAVFPRCHSISPPWAGSSFAYQHTRRPDNGCGSRQRLRSKRAFAAALGSPFTALPRAVVTLFTAPFAAPCGGYFSPSTV